MTRSTTSTGSSSRDPREGLHQRRRRLARPLPGHPPLRHRQGVDVPQHDARAAELAEAARRREARVHGHADVRHGGAWQASRSSTRRASASHPRPRKGHGGGLPRVHATPERLQAMWTTSKQIPAETTSTRRDRRPVHQAVYDTWIAGDKNAYIADLMPTLFWTDAMFVAAQKILAGAMTGEEAGTLAGVTERWKKQNPDMVENYTTWAADLGLVAVDASAEPPHAAHASLGPVPLRRARRRAARAGLRLPARAGRGLLVPPHPGQQRPVGRAQQLPAGLDDPTFREAPSTARCCCWPCR